MWVGSFQEKVDLFGAGVQSTPKARGVWGHATPGKFENRHQNTGFGDISAT